ncbi:hypothetical protein FRC02_005751 [Tulasnella sp. 418]|nr:hypothetical protein FRC02_005751 [Tulasnella sp. 418]
MRHLEHTSALLQGCIAPCLSNEERLRGLNDVGALWRGDYILHLTEYQKFFKKFSGTLGEILQTLIDDEIRMELSDVELWTAVVLKMKFRGNEVLQETSFRIMVRKLKHVSSISGDGAIDDAEQDKRRVLAELLDDIFHGIDAYNPQPRESLFQRLWHSNALISRLRNNPRNNPTAQELEMQSVPNQE